jgi:CBS-domain-containing membrane protein
VHDYVAGKADWLARGLPAEGTEAARPAARDVVRDDVVTCALTDVVGEVHERVKASPYGFALVVAPDRCLLGRLRASALEKCDPGSTAEAVMEAGPSTIRLDRKLDVLVKQLTEREYRYAVATDPDGRLAGVVRRADAEARLSEAG